MREPLNENLMDELTRLVGRPLPVVHEALSATMRTLIEEFDSISLAGLGPFPMTSWPALAPHSASSRRLWGAALSAGLTPEEVFTAFAVLDDHVRRSYGNEAWVALQDWGPRLAHRYGLGLRAAPTYAVRDAIAASAF